MSYTQCPRCGHKALSVATQCPHCGVPFEIRHTYDVAPPRPRGTLVVLVVVALGAVFLGVDLLRREPGAKGGESAVSRQPSAVTVPPSAPRESLPAKVKTSVAPAPKSSLPKQPAARQLDSTPPPPPRPTVNRPPSAPSGSTAEAAAAPAGPSERRYANIWVNVRRARGPSAAVVKVLRPGEPVLVDSLRQGWYRVVTDGQALGYVYQGFVDTVPPTGQ